VPNLCFLQSAIIKLFFKSISKFYNWKNDQLIDILLIWRVSLAFLSGYSPIASPDVWGMRLGPDVQVRQEECCTLSSIKMQKRSIARPLLHTPLDIVDVMRHHSIALDRNKSLPDKIFIAKWFTVDFTWRNELKIYANRFCLLAHFNYVIAPMNAEPFHL
jgi:hypothetical protein